jgi:hypothetical protein
MSSSNIKEEILIDNDEVTVTKVTVPAGEVHNEPKTRSKRVIISLTDHHNHRHEEDHLGVKVTEDVHRLFGDAVFRDASTHKIANISTQEQVSIIVELKK